MDKCGIFQLLTHVVYVAKCSSAHSSQWKQFFFFFFCKEDRVHKMIAVCDYENTKGNITATLYFYSTTASWVFKQTTQDASEENNGTNSEEVNLKETSATNMMRTRQNKKAN